MSPLFLHIVETLLMVVLVALFLWIYAQDQRKRTALWIAGWVCIVLHFANSILLGLLRKPGPVWEFAIYGTLIVSGASFLLSVSRDLESLRFPWRRWVAYALPALLYWAALVADSRRGTLYFVLLVTCLAAGSVRALAAHFSAGATVLCWVLGLAPAVALAPFLHNHAEYGMDYILFATFASTGVMYWRHFGKASPGAVLTAVCFVAWGLVFPVGELFSAFHLGPPDESAFWDLEKYMVAFGMLLTLFEEKTEAAATVARRYRELFDGNLAGVYVATLDGELLDCNLAFCHMYGLESKDDALRVHLDDVHVAPEARVAFIQQVLRQGQVVDSERVQRRRDGSLFWILERATLVTDRDGKLRIEGTAIDITERREFQLRLQTEIAERKAAEEAAHAANEAKSTFLATVSHEIRTPLHGILGLTDLLLVTELDSAQRDDLRLLKNSAESLLLVLNDVLDLAKVEAGKLELENISFSPVEIVSDVVSLMLFRAREKGLALSAALAPDVPPLVSGDPGRLRQVLFNLVGNAIKFTAAGSVQVQLAFVAGDGAGDGRLSLRITDTGIGIPAAKRLSIFQPFAQAEESTARRFGGTGLGLAICSQLVHLMGGEIGVEDGPLGIGSSFWFRVRVGLLSAPAAPAALTSTLAGSPAAGERPLRILLAEDNLVNQLIASRLLRRFGHTLRIAQNGREAVEAFASETFDLILMDVEMPVMNGLEAARAIRDRELHTGSRIPILAMTAKALKTDEARCLSAGMDGFIRKPVHTEHLLKTIASAAQRCTA